jgi:hypothetical protein
VFSDVGLDLTMWKQIVVDPGKLYVLQLCQDSGQIRYFLARKADDLPHPDMVFETLPVSARLVGEFHIEELRNVRLSNGETFSFGPHGEWFTESETKAKWEVLHGLRPWASIPWHNGVSPRLPPK